QTGRAARNRDTGVLLQRPAPGTCNSISTGTSRQHYGPRPGSGAGGTAAGCPRGRRKVWPRVETALNKVHAASPGRNRKACSAPAVIRASTVAPPTFIVTSAPKSSVLTAATVP